jgi:hypothetical protein
MLAGGVLPEDWQPPAPRDSLEIFTLNMRRPDQGGASARGELPGQIHHILSTGHQILDLAARLLRV